MNARLSRSLSLAAAALFISLTAGARIATAQSTITFGVAGGLAVPTGSYLSGLSTGYNIAVSVGMTNRTSPVGFRGEAMFNEMGWGGGSDVNHRIAAATGNLTYDLSGMSGGTSGGLYIIGGGGVYGSYDRGTDITGFEYNSDTAPTSTNAGLNVGGGWRFPLGGMNAYAEARYHYIFGNNNGAGNEQFIPITFGVSF